MFFSLGAARTRLHAGSIKKIVLCFQTSVNTNKTLRPKPARSSSTYDAARSQKTALEWKATAGPLSPARIKVNAFDTPAQGRAVFQAIQVIP
jgi:hypothetical protein